MVAVSRRQHRFILTSISTYDTQFYRIKPFYTTKAVCNILLMLVQDEKLSDLTRMVRTDMLHEIDFRVNPKRH